MNLTHTIIIWSLVIGVILLLFVASWRYFWATSNDTYRSYVRKCSNCARFKSIHSIYNGYCTLWERNVLKQSVCKHYIPKNTWVKWLEKSGF